MVFRIRKPRNISVPQLMLVTVLGVAGGFYIYRPLILNYRKELTEQNKLHNLEETSTDNIKK